MKYLKNVFLSTIVLFSLFFAGCTKDDVVDNTGSNKVLLKATGSSELIVGEKDQVVNVSVTFTKKADKDTPLTVEITNKTNADNKDILKIIGEPILQADKKTVIIKVGLKEGVTVFKNHTFELTLKFTDKQYAKVEPITITVKPAPAISSSELKLTEAKIKLLEGYKAKGMDITPFIGNIKVRATVHSAKGGALKDYANEWTKKFTGVTVITLSDKATADKPVLKMLSNPMGCNEFFYKVMRDETIDNDKYWYGKDADPLYAKVMKLINWNKTSKETFTSSLDGISIDAKNKAVLNFLGKRKGDFGEEINVVPFVFNYSAWDRLKAKIKAGDKAAIECRDADATSNPYTFLNNTDVLEDFYETGAFRKTTGSIDYEKKTMKFSFITSHTNGYDYVQIDVVYTK